MANQAELHEHTEELLGRPAGGQVHLSDVFPEVAALDEEAWWQKTDFDAGLTVKVESSDFPDTEQIPIGSRSWLANYYLVLVDDLLRARDRRLGETLIKLTAEEPDKPLHPDFATELDSRSKAVIAVANYAPRDEKNTKNGANGSDFYLAFTDSGLEVYATPLSFLSSLDARHRITSLYRIPTADHPEFDGEHEQFRSARIIRSRRHPDHLVPIFEYTDRAAVIAAKQEGIHPFVIPKDPRNGYMANVDKFGNVKLELNDADIRQAFELGSIATLYVTSGPAVRRHPIPVELVADLRSAPLNKLVLYTNCSDPDHDDKGNAKSFVELAVRVDKNPSTSRKTAMFELLEKIPLLDPEFAEFTLLPDYR
jgi:hypothetical protein